MENHQHQTSIKLEVGPCQLAHLLSYATRCRVKAVLYVPRLTEWTNRPRGVTSADQRQHSLGSVVFCVWARSRPGNVSWEAIVANNSLSLAGLPASLFSPINLQSVGCSRYLFYSCARARAAKPDKRSRATAISGRLAQRGCPTREGRRRERSSGGLPGNSPEKNFREQQGPLPTHHLQRRKLPGMR